MSDESVSGNRYDFRTIEAKWQQRWEEADLFRVDYDPNKPKFYGLDFFPYPSGAGISVGHCRNYVPLDVVCRLKGMQGYNVLRPMGWDAFGLPAENAAIKGGKSPLEWTNDNISEMLKILKKIGFSYDYKRLRNLALWQLMGFVAQVVLGGITVLTKLNPLAVSGHFLLSIPLVAGALSLRNRYIYQDHFLVNSTTKLLKNIYLLAVIVLIFIGTVVTGSGPLAGDLQAKRYKLDGAQVAQLHSYVAVTVLILFIGIFVSVKSFEDKDVYNSLSKTLIFTAVILISEGAIGYRQFALGLPEVLVGIHILGATLLWVCTWNIHLQMRDR